MFHLRFITFVVFLICGFGVMGLEEHDICTTKAGLQGECLKDFECKSAIESIRKGIVPTDVSLCGFSNHQPIVCCVDSPTDSTDIPIPTSSLVQNENKSDRTGPGPGNKANKMCQVYSAYAYVIVTVSLFGRPHRYLDCRIYNDELIVGPTLPDGKEFPHMVQIGYGLDSDVKWGCAGSLISENYILTAVRCIKHKTKGDAKFVRGGVYTEDHSLILQVREIAEVILPPNYSDIKNESLVLFKVKTNFKLNGFIRPACLYTKNGSPQNRFVTAGWKLAESGDKDGQKLHRVYVQPLAEDKCDKINSICAKAATKGYYGDICSVDIGGPLNHFRPDTADIKCMHDIVGIKVEDTECETGENGINVYTKVYNYIKWIEDTVWP
ncbi:serine protease snake-like [Diabrotica virgifera virgifera]|uniref:Serine protease snake-like n=1 Tax=Diabrotica virgifera virgifera TaxID=50390 RepID=A0A6P7GA89_DIAVI|nr:serine protease snake-like [Diabrotica virgifera virgifera]